jgi:hypothetical protein
MCSQRAVSERAAEGMATIRTSTVRVCFITSELVYLEGAIRRVAVKLRMTCDLQVMRAHNLQHDLDGYSRASAPSAVDINVDLLPGFI